MRIVSANLNYNAGGDRKYLAYLRALVVVGVLCLQERGRGLRGTRVVGVRRWVRRKRWRVLGAIGAHRAAAVGVVRVDGRRVLVISVHGLHVRTVGQAAQERFYAVLAAWCAHLSARGRLWIVCGDFNHHHAAVADLLGGTGVGHGVDGIVVSPGLTVRLVDVDRSGMQEGWSDHPAIVAEVSAGRRHRRPARVVGQQDVTLGGLGTRVAQDLAHSE